METSTPETPQTSRKPAIADNVKSKLVSFSMYTFSMPWQHLRIIDAE